MSRIIYFGAGIFPEHLDIKMSLLVNWDFF